MTMFCENCSKMHPLEKTCRKDANFWVKCLVKFLVKILVKLNNRNSCIHCNKRARVRTARTLVLFPSPLVLLLYSLTKILTNNSTKDLTKNSHFSAGCFKKVHVLAVLKKL